MDPKPTLRGAIITQYQHHLELKTTTTTTTYLCDHRSSNKKSLTTIKVSPHSCRSLLVSQLLVSTLFFLALLTHHDTTIINNIIKPSLASDQVAFVGNVCDFDRYALTGGCYSSANFVCDEETNRCKCHPDMPVLIERRLCVKRAKSNEICYYNEQCDNGNGYYCYYSDYRMVNGTTGQTFNSISIRTSYKSNEHARCRNILNKAKYKQQQQQHQYKQQHYQQPSPPSAQAKQQTTKQNSSPRFLPLLVYIFLFLSFTGVLVLILKPFIEKCDESRFNQSFQRQQADDRISINSDLDVPPPYETAIRMKL